MVYVVTILCAILAMVSADSGCSCPNVDPEVVEKLDDHGSRIDRLVARAERIKDTINRRKREREEADKDSKNMLLRLDKLDLKEEVDTCPEKHFKCVTGGDSAGKTCVANILVCDGEIDCLDGSDEDPNLCRVPVEVGEVYGGRYTYYNCLATEGSELFQLVTLMEIRPSPVLKSNVKIVQDFVWNFRNEEIRYYRMESLYNYGRRGVGNLALYKGLYHIVDTYFTEDAIEGTVYMMASGRECAKIIYTKVDKDVYYRDLFQLNQ